MLAFFTLAARSRNRQQTFRTLLTIHLIALALIFLAMVWRKAGPTALGQSMLVAGIIEGALLTGWRLTQLPKSQALEFLLVSPLRPTTVFVAEALVGLTLLAMTTLAGLPIYLMMVAQGVLIFEDLPILLILPWTWGVVTGLGLAAWSYESPRVRWWGEKLAIIGVLVYLIVGVLAGENLVRWLCHAPDSWRIQILGTIRVLHDHNPFGTMQLAMQSDPTWFDSSRLWWNLGIGGVAGIALLARGALRLHGHFCDEHYRPILPVRNDARQPVGDSPLRWWAVKRVSRYSGRINVFLAGGFALLYAAYALAGPHWPDWLGRLVFQMFDRAGGLPMLATALALLAAVPAAFQYGLWDSGGQDRSRRLELLLLTELDGPAYWQAALSAAWKRGREYFFLSAVLALAAAGSGQATWAQTSAGLAASVVLWCFYFVLGFRAFSRGLQANRLGTTLTMLIPLATYLLAQSGWPALAMLLPPGSIYFGITGSPGWAWAAGVAVLGLSTLFFARSALSRCDAELRNWYQNHHGLRAAE